MTVTPTQARHLATVLALADARDWPEPVYAHLMPDGRIALELASPDHVATWSDGGLMVTYDHDGVKHVGAGVDVGEAAVHCWAPLMVVAS